LCSFKKLQIITYLITYKLYITDKKYFYQIIHLTFFCVYVIILKIIRQKKGEQLMMDCYETKTNSFVIHVSGLVVSCFSFVKSFLKLYNQYYFPISSIGFSI